MLFPKRTQVGFTLIELLIVIAIILILIAIALPNFLEAQIRARVTKAKGEIRSLGQAMEAYYLDWKFYPCESEHNILERPRLEAGLLWLTSPIAYISFLPEDPFAARGIKETSLITYETGGIEYDPQLLGCSPCLVTWAIFTRGPDGDEGAGSGISSADPHNTPSPGQGSVYTYNPTNGTRSAGDIFLYGGDSFWIGVGLGKATRGLYRSNVHDRGLVINDFVYLHRLPPPLQ